MKAYQILFKMSLNFLSDSINGMLHTASFYAMTIQLIIYVSQWVNHIVVCIIPWNDTCGEKYAFCQASRLILVTVGSLGDLTPIFLCNSVFV